MTISRLLSSEKADITVNIKKQLLESIENTNTHYTDLIVAFANEDMSVEGLEKFLGRFNNNRYFEDYSTDLSPIFELVKISLGKLNLDQNLIETLFLLEILSSKDIRTQATFNFTNDKNIESLESFNRKSMVSMLFDASENSNNREFNTLYENDRKTNLSNIYSDKMKFCSVDSLQEVIMSLNEKGVSAVSIGIDVNNHLVVFQSTNKVFSAWRESKTKFDIEKYISWKTKYPYEYKNIQLSDPFSFNTLIRSLNGIGLSVPGKQNPIVFISSTFLQNIPPNLFLVDDEPIGLETPVALAPSLNWLNTISSEMVSWSTNFNAWIPESNEQGGALNRLVENIDDTLSTNNFKLLRDNSEIENLDKSDIVILGAHGGVDSSSMLFSSVSDESNLKLNTLEISKYLNNTNLVILFICSGGKIDQNPFSHSSIGLPYELLDHGCRTVIASPYPLDVQVPKFWLKEFLNNFLKGEKVILSNFKANKVTGCKFDYNPVYSLAMNVYGDPLLKYE